MSTLTITVDSKIEDLSHFSPQPCNITFILNSHMQIDISCPPGWTMEDLPSIIAQSLIETPVTLHIISVTKDLALLN